MTTPEWLKQRGGELKLGSDGCTWYLVFEKEPQYSLAATPVSGKVGCTIRQTINGKRIECKEVRASADEAIGAGLDAVRQALGWA
jgi:hypothetical protein